MGIEFDHGCIAKLISFVYFLRKSFGKANPRWEDAHDRKGQVHGGYRNDGRASRSGRVGAIA